MVEEEEVENRKDEEKDEADEEEEGVKVKDEGRRRIKGRGVRRENKERKEQLAECLMGSDEAT